MLITPITAPHIFQLPKTTILQIISKQESVKQGECRKHGKADRG
jgi:hypothetical protein